MARSDTRGERRPESRHCSAIGVIGLALISPQRLLLAKDQPVTKSQFAATRKSQPNRLESRPIPAAIGTFAR